MEDLITFEQAKILKKLGFDVVCNHWYHPSEPNKIMDCISACNHNAFERPYSAPTLFQVQKWLYEKHNLWVTAELTESAAGFYFDWCIAEIQKSNHLEINMSCAFNGSESYFRDSSECLYAGIDAALKILIEK